MVHGMTSDFDTDSKTRLLVLLFGDADHGCAGCLEFRLPPSLDFGGPDQGPRQGQIGVKPWHSGSLGGQNSRTLRGPASPFLPEAIPKLPYRFKVDAVRVKVTACLPCLSTRTQAPVLRCAISWSGLCSSTVSPSDQITVQRGS